MYGHGAKVKWVGRILTGVPAAFLLFDGAIKLMNIAPVRESFAQLGYSDSVALPIGLLELLCVAIYLVPRTAVLGAVLLTGYLGGAVATHLRTGDPLFTHVLFPTYVGLLIWTGLYLRDGRLRSLLTVRPMSTTT